MTTRKTTVETIEDQIIRFGIFSGECGERNHRLVNGLLERVIMNGFLAEMKQSALEFGSNLATMLDSVEHWDGRTSDEQRQLARRRYGDDLDGDVQYIYLSYIDLVYGTDGMGNRSSLVFQEAADVDTFLILFLSELALNRWVRAGKLFDLDEFLLNERAIQDSIRGALRILTSKKVVVQPLQDHEIDPVVAAQEGVIHDPYSAYVPPTKTKSIVHEEAKSAVSVSRTHLSTASSSRRPPPPLRKRENSSTLSKNTTTSTVNEKTSRASSNTQASRRSKSLRTSQTHYSGAKTAPLPVISETEEYQEPKTIEERLSTSVPIASRVGGSVVSHTPSSASRTSNGSVVSHTPSSASRASNRSIVSHTPSSASRASNRSVVSHTPSSSSQAGGGSVAPPAPLTPENTPLDTPAFSHRTRVSVSAPSVVAGSVVPMREKPTHSIPQNQEPHNITSRLPDGFDDVIADDSVSSVGHDRLSDMEKSLASLKWSDSRSDAGTSHPQAPTIVDALTESGRVERREGGLRLRLAVGKK